jgi:hypothetical protein
MNQISSKIFFNSINSNIRIIGTGIKSLYNIIDMSNGLGYCNQGYLRKYYCYERKDAKDAKDAKLVYDEYIDIYSISNILNRGRKPNCKKLLQEILTRDKINYKVIMPERVEIDIFKSIYDYYLDNLNIEIISNKYIDGYYPDIIIKKDNIVMVIIEINEMNHSYCTKRMNKIKINLDCKNFLNINPHDANFSIGKLIKNIKQYVD